MDDEYNYEIFKQDVILAERGDEAALHWLWLRLDRIDIDSTSEWEYRWYYVMATNPNYCDTYAMLALYELYMKGIYVDKDEVEALKWMNRAADLGDTIALKERMNYNFNHNNLDKILDEITQNKLGSAHLVSAICMQLYIETLRLFDKKYNCFSSLYDEKDIIVDNIKKYIDDNFSTTTLSIVDLEKIFHISHYYLSRLFKKKTGITIKEYLILTRMNFAKEKLLNSQCVISEIAKDSGYNDIYHFFKEFKKRYGISPKTYRKINSKKE